VPAVPIAKRYVKPDVLRSFDLEQRFDEPNESSARERSSTSSMVAADQRREEQRSNAIMVREHRISIDRLLAGTDRAIIAGDAGLGKSTLLRMLALDILSEAPQFDCVRDRYAELLPVWLSFPLWARMASERAAPPAIEEVVVAFLRAQNQPELAEGMRKALAGSRIILLVDGLDEAADPTAAETVAALLSSFVEARGCPALITTRAQGLRAATSFGGHGFGRSSLFYQMRNAMRFARCGSEFSQKSKARAAWMNRASSA
jgi:predicted NACHT family NTPase